MVFAFAGDSTMTSFFVMARHRSDASDRASRLAILPRCAPRPSPLYLLIGCAQLAVAAARVPAACAGAREPAREGGYVLAANHSSNFDPWPLGMPLFPRRYLRFMAKSELFWTPLGTFIAAGGAFPVRRGERDHRGDRDRRRSSAARASRGHVPGGDAPQEGDAEEARGAVRTPARRGSRSRREVPLVPAGIVGTDRLARLAQLRVAYGPPIPLDDLAGREEAPRLATERLMAAIGELEASA